VDGADAIAVPLDDEVGLEGSGIDKLELLGASWFTVISKFAHRRSTVASKVV